VVNWDVIIALAALALILAKWLAELGLLILNRRHVRAHAAKIPAAFNGVVDEATYAKSVAYTLTRSRFSQFTDTYGTLILSGVLFSGLLPAMFQWSLQRAGASAWAMGAFLFGVGLLLTLPGLPVSWVEQFRLEERFGFNTSTQHTWWMDRLKGLLLALALGYPLLVFLLKIVEWTGALWWLWAWGAFMGFQLLMTVLAPFVILPLFNKLTPLPEGPLKERLVALAHRTQFVANDIQVMDGSRRSRHSNAFFTGFGRLRKIVLFDTLIDQLSETELEAVLAHEIGHYKRRHIPKMLLGSALGSLAGFYAMALLVQAPTFVQAFGFQVTHAAPPFTASGFAPVLLLFGLLSGTVTFWMTPLMHWLTRRYEYEADAFARDVMNDAAPIVGALRKLSEKNLSNLTPHPIYSGFYYSHPTLSERERSLRKEPHQ
jgi:STE24 endopeptidase